MGASDAEERKGSVEGAAPMTQFSQMSLESNSQMSQMTQMSAGANAALQRDQEQQ